MLQEKNKKMWELIILKAIFSYNRDINKNAYMNWRTNKYSHINNMITIADGFILSAILLCENALENNHDMKADIIIFPILFNTNHAIELYLKAITWTLNVLLNNNSKIEGNHDIKQIFSVVESRVNEFETDKEKKKRFQELTKRLKNYLNELFDKIETYNKGKRIDNMDFSRYPFNQQYINHFYINEFDNVTIDLENFLEIIKDIGDSLHMISSHYLFDFLEADTE